MKKIRIIGCLLIVMLQVIMLKAQSITPAEINTGGASATSTSVNLEYSIGNAFQSSVVANHITLSTVNGRVATEEEVETLPEPLKNEILQSKAGIKAWPIPSEGEINVMLEGVDQATEARIFDQTGKVIMSFDIQPHEPALLNNLPVGLYFLKTSNKDIPTIRLIVK